MSKLNLLIHVNAYEDTNPSNNPSNNLCKWQRDSQGIDISEPESKSLSLPAGQAVSLFSGSISNSSDASTTWNIALKSGTSQTYKISKASGTSPAFRVQRTSGADATTGVTVTKNTSLITLSSTVGTSLNLITGGVVVGDEVRIGSLFNLANQGKFKILARTATSLTFEHNSGVAEGPIVLGAGFASQLDIFSSDGVQVGNQVDLIAGFSLVSFSTYEITDVSPDYIEIFSLKALPTENGISNNPSALLIYNNAKSFVYIESDKKLEIKINGSATPNGLEPMAAGTALKPGVFMSSSSIKSLEITNKSQDVANIFFVTAE
jgi:hypothetical protein